MKVIETEKSKTCYLWSRKYKSWDYQIIAADSWREGWKTVQSAIYEDITIWAEKYKISLEAFSELSDIVALANEYEYESEYPPGTLQSGEKSTDRDKYSCPTCYKLR